MPFNSLLLTSLVPEGEIDENGVGVALIPSEQAEETMLLFKADNDDFKAYLQNNQKIPKNQKKGSTPSCCDLVWFAYQKFNNKPKITICLIELKGGDNDQINKAADQILQTRDGILMGLRKSGRKEENIIWKALIISRSNLSQPGERFKDLIETFKNNVSLEYGTIGKINLTTQFMQTIGQSKTRKRKRSDEENCRRRGSDDGYHFHHALKNR